MGHANFSPRTQDVVCSATGPYYVTVSHERTTGHDRKDSNPKTIVDGYKPSNDKRFTVDRSWERQISSDWTKTFKFEGIFLGSVTIKHHSYYQNWRRYEWKTRTDWRYATFNIWLPSHSNVSYKKLWNPVDKTIFITYKAESAEKLDEIISKQISIYNYEPSNIAKLSGYRWEKVSEKEAKLYLDIGYNFSFVKRIIKISAGTTNLCTVVQIENKSFWKSAIRTVYAPDGTSTTDTLSIGKYGFTSVPFFITEGKISITFEKDVSFLEAYPVDDFSPEEEVVPENDISLINVEVNKASVSFTANAEEYYDYCRGAFIFTDGTNVFGRIIAVQCENAFLQGGTNPKIERTFFNINYNKDVYPVNIRQDSYNKFLKNPMFLLLGYKGYSPVFSFVFDGVKDYRTERGNYYWWKYAPVKDTAEFIILYSDGSTKKICIRYRASAYTNSDKDMKLFGTLSESGEIEELPNEKVEDGGDGDIIFKVVNVPYLLFKRESGALIKANFNELYSDKFPRTLRNIDKSEMTKVYETPIMFPIVGEKYHANYASEETKDIEIFYGISEIRSATVEVEIAPLYKEYGSEIISAEAFCYSVEPKDGYYNNIVETKVEKRDDKFFVIITARQSSFLQTYSYSVKDSTSIWGIRWTENKKSPMSVTLKKRVSFLFYREYPYVFETTIVSLNGIKGSTFAYLDKSKKSTPYRVRVKSSRFSSSIIGFSFVEGAYRKECSATLIEHDEKTNEWEYELLAVPSRYSSNTVTCFVNAKFEFGNLGIKTIEASYKYNRPAIRT